ncbi:uncharacterized protein LOC115963225 isoform X4 [Quercus lobata]|uniref:uncharacterized protein LOC115963225 isoform X4 n=1 Tax=Quercus lobata TaxID=97700 RepID=UPI0012476CBE|nr:uncharacterized protein LOC115963225 isoform X4 [Quercus lobata]
MPQRNRLLHLCFPKWIRLMEDCTISRRRCLFKTLKHCKTLVELEKGVDGLFGSFARLDSRISSVGLTAAKIDHLQGNHLHKGLHDHWQKFTFNPRFIQLRNNCKSAARLNSLWPSSS